MNIRALVNKEGCELRLLRSALLGMYGTAQHAGRRRVALRHLHGYCTQLLSEAGTDFKEELREVRRKLHGVPGPPPRALSYPPPRRLPCARPGGSERRHLS